MDSPGTFQFIVPVDVPYANVIKYYDRTGTSNEIATPPAFYLDTITIELCDSYGSMIPYNGGNHVLVFFLRHANSHAVKRTDF